MTPMPQRVRAIVESVAAEHRLRPEDLIGPSRRKIHIEPRWRCWAIIRSTPGPSGQVPSLPLIGAWFGRDHTSIIHGLRRLCG